MKEIEDLPIRYHDILNDYIRVGKRLLHQKEDLLSPLLKRVRELRNLFESKLGTYESKSFSIHNTQTGVQMICYPKHWTGDGLWVGLRIIGANTFNDVFENMFTSLDENSITPHKEDFLQLREELSELISKIKKENSLLFFEYVRTRDELNVIDTGIAKKQNILNALYRKIEKMWNEDFPLESGTKVLFYMGKRIEKGIVKYTDNDAVYIKTEKGRTVARERAVLSWDKKFGQSQLSKCLNSLYVRVPEEWSENRLNFYPIS